MKRIVKMAALTAAASVALAVAAAATPPEYIWKLHYDEQLTEVLNNQPYRPDWSGPAPIFYKNKGIPAQGFARVTVGVGDPGIVSDKEVLFEIMSEASAISSGRGSLVVTYDPESKRYKAYSWRERSFFGKPGSTLVANYEAEKLPINVLKGALSGNQFKLAPRARQNYGPMVFSDAQSKRIAAVNEKYR